MLQYFTITLSDFLVAQQSYELVIINDNQTFNLHTVSRFGYYYQIHNTGEIIFGTHSQVNEAIYQLGACFDPQL